MFNCYDELLVFLKNALFKRAYYNQQMIPIESNGELIIYTKIKEENK